MAPIPIESGQSNICGESRRNRFLRSLRILAKLPPASNALEAYAQLCNTLNEVEDIVFGSQHWNPPRTFLTGVETTRLYPIFTESFFAVTEFPGVQMLLARKELVFISRFGAIQVQNKSASDKTGDDLPFFRRSDEVIFTKDDKYGDDVWHEKNRT